MTTTPRATAYAAGEANLPAFAATRLRRLLGALSAWRRCRAASAELQAQHDPERVRQWLRLEWH